MKESSFFSRVVNSFDFRLAILVAWVVLLVPTISSYDGKWPAFRTVVNIETTCKNKVCERNPEWKQTMFYEVRNESPDGPVPLIKGLLVQQICVKPSGTGASLISTFTVEANAPNSILVGKLVNIDYSSSKKKNCIFAPQNEIISFRVLDVKYDDASEENIEQILKNAGTKGLSGPDDKLLEQYSFSLELEYQLTWLSWALSYFICAASGYLAIEISGKTRNWLTNGKHK